jgi:hypothetical protein
VRRKERVGELAATPIATEKVVEGRSGDTCPFDGLVHDAPAVCPVEEEILLPVPAAHGVIRSPNQFLDELPAPVPNLPMILLNVVIGRRRSVKAIVGCLPQRHAVHLVQGIADRQGLRIRAVEQDQSAADRTVLEDPHRDRRFQILSQEQEAVPGQLVPFHQSTSILSSLSPTIR